jgi:hypothetical protein
MQTTRQSAVIIPINGTLAAPKPVSTFNNLPALLSANNVTDHCFIQLIRKKARNGHALEIKPQLPARQADHS